MNAITRTPVMLALVTLHLTALNNGQVEATRYTFELPDNEKSCFYEEFSGGNSFYAFEFEVVAGGELDVDAYIESPNNLRVYDARKQRQGEHRFETSHGVWKICFSNEFSTFTHKTIFFQLANEALKPLAVEAGQTQPTVRTQMEESLESIHVHQSRVAEFQTAYRNDEARGRHQADELNLRVQWWSIGETLVIFFCGIGQVVILRAFFNNRRFSSSRSNF